MRDGSDDGEVGIPEPEGQPSASASGDARQCYQTPRLRHLGKLAELTLGGNLAGMNDPGGPSTGKF